jgi:hypothetical protein
MCVCTGRLKSAWKIVHSAGHPLLLLLLLLLLLRPAAIAL